MVCRRRWKDKKNKMFRVSFKLEFSGGKAVRLPKILDLRRTPLQKSATTLAAMSLFYPCTKFSTKELFGRSVNHHQKRVSLRPIKFQNSLEFMTSGLLHRSVMRPLDMCVNPQQVYRAKLWDECYCTLLEVFDRSNSKPPHRFCLSCSSKILQKLSPFVELGHANFKN